MSLRDRLRAAGLLDDAEVRERYRFVSRTCATCGTPQNLLVVAGQRADCIMCGLALEKPS